MRRPGNTIIELPIELSQLRADLSISTGDADNPSVIINVGDQFINTMQPPPNPYFLRDIYNGDPASIRWLTSRIIPILRTLYNEGSNLIDQIATCDAQGSLVIELLAQTARNIIIRHRALELPVIFAENIASRDALPLDRRRVGLRVYVQDTREVWELRGSIENTNWYQEHPAEAGRITAQPLYTLQDIEDYLQQNTPTGIRIESKGFIDGSYAICVSAFDGALASIAITNYNAVKRENEELREELAQLKHHALKAQMEGPLFDGE